MESSRNRIEEESRGADFINARPDLAEIIFLAGSGRSGTTWVSNIINHKNEYRYLFEPFKPDKVSLCEHFKLEQYLKPDSQDEKFMKPVKAILAGKIANEWIDRFNKNFNSNKGLIKETRANLLLKWLNVNFPEVPIILLLRHPCPVALSRIKMGWGGDLKTFLSQEELMEDFLAPFGKEIEKAKDLFERQIFYWCIENYVPLRQFQRGEIHLAFYENFCVTPELEVERLFSFLGKSYDEQVYAALRNPSLLSREWSAITIGEDLVESWRKHITNEQLKRAVEIMSLFELDKLYSEGAMPNVHAVI